MGLLSDERRELEIERDADEIIAEFKRRRTYEAWLEAWDALAELYVAPKIIDLWLGPCPEEAIDRLDAILAKKKSE